MHASELNTSRSVGAELVEIAGQEFGGGRGDLDRRENPKVPAGLAPRADGRERAFALSAVEELPDLERIAACPIMELCGHVAHLHAAAADVGEQFLDIFAGQRFELDSLQAIGFQSRGDRIELTRPVRAQEQNVAEGHRQEFGE